MRKFKNVWKIQLVLLLTIAGLMSFSFSANAAEKLPYEYTYEKNHGVKFNGIEEAKTIKMTFYDKKLSASDIVVNGNINVWQGKEKVNILKGVIVDGNTVTMTFKNLEYLDYSKGVSHDYELVIDKDAKLHFDQLTDYTLPFSIHEILPGFESIFVKSTQELINNNILKHNAPVDVQIFVPKAYLTEIKTAHRYKGIADLENLESHSLTNIDVMADIEATRLKVSVNDEDQFARDLDYRQDVKGFSMGQAGLEALICDADDNCTGAAKDFHLTAYNGFGKLLTNRNFKLKVLNNNQDFIVNDYLQKPDKIFGQETTLLALMTDPKLLEAIVTQLPVTELDRLGVIYSLGSKAEVANHEQLMMALKNEQIKTITLKGSIIGDVDITRNVTIEGSSNAIVGNVTLGNGTDIVARLKNTTVTKDVTIDVGANGSAILEDTEINGSTTVTSGSVHLFNFKASNGITLDNESDVRMVSVNSTPNLQMNTDKEVTLIGSYGTITVNHEDAKLTIMSNTDIEKIVVNADKKLTLTKPKDKAMPPYEGEIVVIDTDPIEGEGGQTVNEWYYPEMLSESAEAWEEIGVRPVFDRFPAAVEWTVVNPNVFGAQSKVVFQDGLLQIVDVNAEQTKEVILQGVYDNQLYRVTILVEIDLQ